jgi:hypothetical protein
MKNRGKSKNIEQANLILEQSYLKSKGLLKEDEKINEAFGLGVLAVAGLAFAATGIYDKARQLWSKHVIGEKYQKTGKEDEVNKEKLTQYKDKEGKLYWGYDHKYNPDPQMGDSPSKDIYTAIFNESDLDRLKKYLNGIKVKTSKPEYDYLDKPKVVDMVYRSSLVDPDEGNY